MKKNFSLKPFQPDARISNFRSSFEYLGNGTLNLDFSLEGQVDLLNFVKTSAEPLSWGHDLWRNTCFELFLAFPGFPGYWEWNFSLSGEVCCYSFADYRSHVFLDTSFKDNLGGVLKSSFDKSSTLLRKTIHLNLEILPNFSWFLNRTDFLEISLCSVLKFENSETTFWCARHSEAKANFHDRATWSQIQLRGL